MMKSAEQATTAAEPAEDERAWDGLTDAEIEARLVLLANRVLDENDPTSSEKFTFLNARFDAGLAWVQYPAGLGGLGLHRKFQTAVDNVFKRAGAPDNDPRRNAIGLANVAPTLAEFGTAEQKQLIRPLWTGEQLWCQLFSEPGAGSDLAGLATKAVRDGDEWVIDGQKVWTSNGHIADWGLLLARTAPDAKKHRGITCFFIDMKTAGVDVRPLRQLTGEAEFNETFLTGARLPDSQRISQIDQGWQVAIYTLLEERVNVGAEMNPGRELGVVGRVARTWRESPNGRTPEMHDRLIKLWAEADASRLFSHRLRQRMAAGQDAPEAAGIKISFARVNQQMSSLEVELLGEQGLRYDFWELTQPERVEHDRRTPAYRYLHAKDNSVAGGTTEIILNIISERILGLPPEHRVDKDVPWKELRR